MSDKDSKDAKDGKAPKKGGKLKLIGIATAGLLLIGGGGAAAGYWIAGNAAAGHGEDAGADRPQLVPRDGEAHAPAAPASGGRHGAAAPAASTAHGTGGNGSGTHGDGPPEDRSRFTATYHTIETPFTSNLAESDSFVQLQLGIATYYDGRVIDNLRTHEVAVRSAVLMALAQQDADLVASAAGREMLQQTLTRAINETLREKTGFGGIDNVYFTSFVVQ